VTKQGSNELNYVPTSLWLRLLSALPRKHPSWPSCLRSSRLLSHFRPSHHSIPPAVKFIITGTGIRA